MARYASFIGMCVLLSLYCIYYMVQFQSNFINAINLMKEVFHSEVDPTLLDGFVTYECLPEIKYTVNDLP